MKRFIAATLTLALISGLSSGKASAQDALSVTIDSEGGSTDLYSPDTVDGLIAIIAFAATETGIVDPSDRLSVLNGTDYAMDAMPDFLAPNDCPSGMDPDAGTTLSAIAIPNLIEAGRRTEALSIYGVRRYLGSDTQSPTHIDRDLADFGLDGCDAMWVSTEGVMVPYGCPNIGGQEGEDIVDLWFELVDAGYTEDEAFDLVEMVIGEGLVARLNDVDVDISNCNSAGRMERRSDRGERQSP